MQDIDFKNWMPSEAERNAEVVVIPEGVKKIGRSAFSGCTNLKEVNIPDGIKTIGDSAFGDCTNLTSITIPESVEKIGDSAFEGCTNLTSLTLPESVEQIGEFAFSGCTNLTSLTLPESVEKFGRSAFSGCTNLKEVNIPDGIKTIGNSAFIDCTNLTSIVFPESVEKIGWSAFEGCTNLTSITIPESVEEIGGFVFGGCKNLKEVNIPDGVKTIGGSAFEGCTNLTSIVFPESVEKIGWSAFSGCTNLKEVNIPDGIKTIGNSAFSGCTNLTFITDNAKFSYKQLQFTEILSDGLLTNDCFKITKMAAEILGDDTYSPILVSKLCKAEHNNKLDIEAEKIAKDFKTIGFYDISSTIDKIAKEKITEMFENNVASRGVVPKIIDALTIASTTLNISPEQIVKSFEDKKFRDAIVAMRTNHHGNHFFDVEATLFAMTFDSNTVKDVIINNPYKDYASVLLCDAYKNRNEQTLNLAKWIAYHPTVNQEIITSILKYKSGITLDPRDNVDAVKAQISKSKAMLEIKQIENEYEGFHFNECKCNLPKVEVELGKYKAYILDEQDPRQTTIGYDTDCCQHLGGAGETAMMYGLINPDAGFFVIEDKETGKILAQAECWTTRDTIAITGKEIEFSDEMIAKLSRTLEDACNEGYINIDNMMYLFDISPLTEYSSDPEFSMTDNPIWTCNQDGSLQAVHNPEKLLTALYQDDDLRAEFNNYLKEYGIHPNGIGKSIPAVLNERGFLYELNFENKEMLVFDNIEFADDRQIEQFAPIIGKWCEKCDYDNVLMGNGYNEMSNNKIKIVDGIKPPECDEIHRLGLCVDEASVDIISKEDLLDYICDDVYVSVLNDEIKDSYLEDLIIRADEYGYCFDKSDFEDDMSLEEIKSRISNTLDIDYVSEYEEVYTDADESCSILKIDGKIEPFLQKAYDSYMKDHPKEKPVVKKETTKSVSEQKKTYRPRIHR